MGPQIIQKYRVSCDDPVAVKKTLHEYKLELCNFLPVAMARVWFYCLNDDFSPASHRP
jgi:hypothetical protein